MVWKDLAGSLVKAGAPLIGGALGGPLGATVGTVVGRVVADALGVEATPEAVDTAIKSTPPEVLQAKLSEAEAKWQAMADIAKAQAEVGVQQEKSVNEAIIAETARGDGLLGKWRGFHAWELTLECPFWAALFMYVILTNNTAALNAIVSMQPLISTVIFARFGVLGVHVWQGSNERQAALTGEAKPGLVSAIAKGIRNR